MAFEPLARTSHMARMKKVKINSQQLALAIDPHTQSVLDVLS